MVWKWIAQILFEHFPTINSIISNAAELRLQSRHIVGVAMENRPPMKRRERASEIPQSNEGCDHSQGGTTRTPKARGPAVADFKDDSPTELQRIA
jgi:hypothetical protein